MTNCEFYDLPHHVLVVNGVDLVNIDQIKVMNVSATDGSDDDVISINNAVYVTLNNSYNNQCSGSLGCVLIGNSNRSIVDNFECIRCSGEAAGYYSHDIDEVYLSNFVIKDNYYDDDGSSLAAGVRLIRVGNLSFDTALFPINSQFDNV